MAPTSGGLPFPRHGTFASEFDSSVVDVVFGPCVEARRGGSAQQRPRRAGLYMAVELVFRANPAARKVNALLGVPPGGALNLRAVARRCRAQKNPANTHAPSPFAHRTLCRRIVGAW